MLLCLQGDIQRLAPALEQVVGTLHTVQSLINEDKRIAVASATVRQEMGVASALFTVQVMLASLGVEQLCSALKNMNLAPQTAPNGLGGVHQHTNAWS